jgi:hypothetical protein
MKIGPKYKAAAFLLLGVGPIIYAANGVNLYIYTRAEGRMLEQRIDRGEVVRDKDLEKIEARLTEIQRDIKELLKRR